MSNSTITEFTAADQPWFEKLNRAWIEKYFWMEPIDVEVLQHPDEHIIQPGGSILVARLNQEIVGVVALKYVSPGVYEFTKMAVDEKFQGLKIGRALSEAAIAKAKSMDAHSIILYSHTSLINAIALYRKLGFVEVPVDGPYKRSDIKMQLTLTGLKPEIRKHKVTHSDLSILREVAIQSFRDLLEKSNTAEDMKLYIDNNLSYEQLEKEFHESGTKFFLFFDGDTPMAYLKLRVGYEPEELKDTKALEIERLYCIQEYVGKSVGIILMQTALDYATANNYELVWLGVWEHNPRAMAFYEKWGFEKFGSHVFMLGTDAQTDLLMKKYLLPV
ncbi:MAG: GNAT family N-acetyltransferase [Cyclobacteriaceae bacterium]|nr:GNAT family N-acetyltransferase [Cyclobacteriaceae bacterium]